MIAMSLPSGRYFHPKEMACRDGTGYPDHWGVRLAVLFDAMDVIREAWGRPVTVVSGYRTPTWNASKDGAKSSMHMHGKAADLRPYAPSGEGRSAATIHAFHRLINLLIEDGKLPAIGGVGLYPLVEDKTTHLWVPGWCHIDTRQHEDGGHIARWTGAKQGDEQVV